MILLAFGSSLALATGLGLLDRPPAEVHLAAAEQPAIPEAVPIAGPWKLVGSVDGVRSYEAKLPIRPRVLFFSQAPEGMRLLRSGRSLRYAAMLDERNYPDSWEFSADGIIVRVGAASARPQPDEFRLIYPQAADRELALFPTADQSKDPAWVVQSAQVDDVTRRGLYLPTPSEVAWRVDVPEGGVLAFSAGILPPEIDDRSRSDGSEVLVWVDHEPAARIRVQPGVFEEHRVPLGAWAGKTVRLAFRTADALPLRDHVFVAEPQIYVPKTNPKRLLMVFVDTLRRDHLGTYGYTRAPAPKIDALAARSVVFEDARSVAPWTLPSTRSVLTGQQPEFWNGSTTIGERLSSMGWATAAYVGNVYLSSNFEMSGGWGEHGCVNWPPADLQVDRAIDFLDRHPDQDALMMVHFMDLHLPYKEPLPYMWLYAGSPPEGVGLFFTRTMLMRLPTSLRPMLREYLIDRYDQNLRYVDDALARLVRAAGDDATIAFFSDHGEEFFDHGDLEHGHTLYDELLRIPMFIRSPDLEPRRVPDPVSLLDVTPTLLDLLGIPDDTLAGRSLLPQARGERSDPGRSIAFGRPLYGETAWGAVRDGMKYITREGAERLYDLARDPDEQLPLDVYSTAGDRTRGGLAAGTGYDVRLAWRISPSGRTAPTTGLEVHVPGGIAEAWVGDDPTMKSEATVRRPDDETAVVSFSGMYGIQREVFIVPRRPIEDVTDEVSIRFNRPIADPAKLRYVAPAVEPVQLAKLSSGGRGYVVTWATLPLPVGEGTVGADAEMNAALQAIGYLTPDRGGPDEE